MVASTHRSDQDTFEGTNPGFVLSSRESLVPLDERKVRRSVAFDHHVSSSTPIHESPNYLDACSKAPSMPLRPSMSVLITRWVQLSDF